MAAKIRKGDRVLVLKGRDRGKEGEVLRVSPSEGRAWVRGVHVHKKHLRPTQSNPGGIESREGPIALSNLALKDPSTGKPTRIGFRRQEDGMKVRYAKGSDMTIEGAS